MNRLFRFVAIALVALAVSCSAQENDGGSCTKVEDTIKIGGVTIEVEEPGTYCGVEGK
jgi:hypothetical protein